jgi:hypothetical protein
MLARRLFACVLLLLLVFQPAAATVCANAMRAQASSEAGSQAEMPCHHGGIDATHSAQAQDDGAQQHASADASHEGCASAACGLCSALAQTLPPVAAVSQHEKLAASPASRFISFVPEGLQRPPSIRA